MIVILGHRWWGYHKKIILENTIAPHSHVKTTKSGGRSISCPGPEPGQNYNLPGNRALANHCEEKKANSVQLALNQEVPLKGIRVRGVILRYLVEICLAGKLPYPWTKQAAGQNSTVIHLIN